jgi:hypothetical protein
MVVIDFESIATISTVLEYAPESVKVLMQHSRRSWTSHGVLAVGRSVLRVSE